MKRTTRALATALLCAAVGAAGCGGGASQPDQPERLPQAASLIPVAPAPQPTATPTPTAEPDPLEPWYPPSGDASGDPGDCGEPLPPAVSRFSISVQGGNGERVLLDSTPLVGPDQAYCASIGFTDGRLYCPVRPEGSGERAACEAARVGRAADTGRDGPTWSVDGRRCDGSGDPGCVNHPTNQYLVYAYGAGTFRACASNGACGEIELP